MSEKAVSIHVSSSWEAINQVPLEESVTLVQFSDDKRDEDSSPTDMVELETCVLLSQPVEENGNQNFSPQPCTLSLRLESAPQDFITSIIIVCEARVIEVHGACNEYLGTIPADLIDTIDDTTIYSADINLSQLTRECTLKFARLGRPSDMWLYGVKVIWKSSGDLQKNNVQSTGLNLETVEQR